MFVYSLRLRFLLVHICVDFRVPLAPPPLGQNGFHCMDNFSISVRIFDSQVDPFWHISCHLVLVTCDGLTKGHAAEALFNRPGGVRGAR